MSPYVDKQPEKIYYSIGEVADLFGVNASLIRFWEKEFDLIKPHKNKKGNRQFTYQDILTFRKIFDLVKRQGHTLEGAKQKLKETIVNSDKNSEIYQKLLSIRHKLIELDRKL